MWVENGLSEIRESFGINCWRHVPTERNPADIAARCNKEVKFNEVLWFKGASFLTQVEKGWPRCEAIGDISENVDEKEVIVTINLTSISQAVLIHSESSLQLHSTHSSSCSRIHFHVIYLSFI